MASKLSNNSWMNFVEDHRETGIDVIKVISTIFIVLQHYLSFCWRNLDVQGGTWKIANIIFLTSRFAIPLFIMCSGAGMLRKDRSIRTIWNKNIKRLAGAYVFWMFIFGVCEGVVALRNGYGVKVFISSILKQILFGSYHTWFIFALIGLYAMTPMLRSIVKDDRLRRYTLSISLVCTVGLPLLGRFEVLGRIYDNISNLQMQYLTGYIMYYLLGYSIWKNKERLVAKKKLLIITGVVIWLLMLMLSTYESIAKGEPAQDLFSDFSIGLAVVVICIFSIGVSSLNKCAGRNLFAQLAKYGMVIYLLHPLLLRFIHQGNLLMDFMIAIMVYVATALIGNLISKIPVVNKIAM